MLGRKTKHVMKTTVFRAELCPAQNAHVEDQWVVIQQSSECGCIGGSLKR